VAVPLLLALLGCSPDTIKNSTYPLSDLLLSNENIARTGFNYDPNTGGRNPANPGRNPIGAGFINRTQYRVLGTFGGYDPQDRDTQAWIGQLGVTSEFNLQPNDVSRVYAVPVARAFSLGGTRLLELVYENDMVDRTGIIYTYPFSLSGASPTPTPAEFVVSSELLKVGVGFCGVPFSDPQRWVPTQGTAPAQTWTLGNDYSKDSILIFDFRQEGTGIPSVFTIQFRTTDQLGIDAVKLVDLSATERLRYLSRFDLDSETVRLLTALGTRSQSSSAATKQPGIPFSNPEVRISNQTGTALSIAFSGPEFRTIGIAQGLMASLVLAPGHYNYLATAQNLTPFFGADDLELGFIYTYVFYTTQ
jgi:hypothetical protein